MPVSVMLASSPLMWPSLQAGVAPTSSDAEPVRSPLGVQRPPLRSEVRSEATVSARTAQRRADLLALPRGPVRPVRTGMLIERVEDLVFVAAGLSHVLIEEGHPDCAQAGDIMDGLLDIWESLTSASLVAAPAPEASTGLAPAGDETALGTSPIVLKPLKVSKPRKPRADV